MFRIRNLIVAVIFVGLAFPLRAQQTVIRPYVGYATVHMGEVNDDMRVKASTLSRETGHNLPAPDPFKGNYAWGVQAEYRIGDDYFANVTTYFFREKTAADYSAAKDLIPVEFRYSREIQYWEFTIGLHYYFSYSSWRRLNTYIGAGVGVGLGWSHSDFYYDESSLLIDNHGDFSSNAMTAYFCLGGTVRLTGPLSLSGEAGYRVANLREMSGTLRTREADYSDFITQAKYDFSGFYAVLGLGYAISLF